MDLDDEEKIPVEQVLDDWYNPNGGPVSWAARDYYYTHYATEEEKKAMDCEEKFENAIAMIGWIAFIGLFIADIVISLLM